MNVVLLKAHNKGYTRKDGTYVKPFDDKRPNAKPAASQGNPPGKPAHGGDFHWEWHAGAMIKVPGAAPDGKPATAPNAKQAATAASVPSASKGDVLTPKQGDLFGGLSKQKPPPKYPAYHPKLNEDGKPHGILYPSKATNQETWADPESTAVFLPGGQHPASLNGIDLEKWTEAPITDAGWNYVDGQNHIIDEPEFNPPKGASPGSGVVIIEPDGRVWLVDPTNGFAGYKSTFPKGHQDHGLNLQANAIKECFEESGLKVEITGFLGDFQRTTTYSRYYLARRVAGTPTDCGWESQSVRLVPKDQLLSTLNRENDQEIAKKIDGVSTGHAAESPESTSGWTKIGGQQGSNSGGTFEDPNGRKWYVKFPDKHAHAADLVNNEMLANQLYHAAGIEVPDCKLVQYHGKPGIASRIIDGLSVDGKKLTARAKGVAEGWAVDCWLANYDVAGLVFDNLLVAGDGRAVRIDQGGSLLYRAQGAPKGDKFGDKVTETATFLNGVNQQTAHVFKGITQKQKEASVARVLAIDDATIHSLCNRYGPGSKKDRAKLAARLIARRDDLGKQFPGAEKFLT